MSVFRLVFFFIKSFIISYLLSRLVDLSIALLLLLRLFITLILLREVFDLHNRFTHTSWKPRRPKLHRNLSFGSMLNSVCLHFYTSQLIN